jgi:hypothetical protein
MPSQLIISHSDWCYRSPVSSLSSYIVRWTDKPLEPNCIQMSDETVSQLGLKLFSTSSAESSDEISVADADSNGGDNNDDAVNSKTTGSFMTPKELFVSNVTLNKIRHQVQFTVQLCDYLSVVYFVFVGFMNTTCALCKTVKEGYH